MAIRKLFTDIESDNEALEVYVVGDLVEVDIRDMDGGRPGRSVSLTAADAMALSAELLRVAKLAKAKEGTNGPRQ